MYIVFEGVVGTGKSTQSKKLVEKLQALYPEREVVWVREPGSTPIAEAIRTLVQATPFDEEMHALTDAYLYAASRAQLINTRVAHILDKGGIVVSDRSFCSSLAYQGHAQGLWLERVWSINKEAVSRYLPDLILYLTVELEIALSRTFDASGDKWESKKKDFFASVTEGFEAIEHRPVLADKWKTIDASGNLEEVEKNIREVVNKALTKKTPGLRTAIAEKAKA
jgi:dTMP kinase